MQFLFSGCGMAEFIQMHVFIVSNFSDGSRGSDQLCAPGRHLPTSGGKLDYEVLAPGTFSQQQQVRGPHSARDTRGLREVPDRRSQLAGEDDGVQTHLGAVCLLTSHV